MPAAAWRGRRCRAAQPAFREQVDGFVPLATTVFAVGRRSAHVSDKTIEQVGNCFACPRISHRDPNAVDVLQSGSYAHELIVMGVEGQNGDNLARTQANAAINHPEQTVTEGGGQGHAPQLTSCLDAHNRQADDPVDDGLWTRCALDAERGGQQTQDATDGAKADAGL